MDLWTIRHFLLSEVESSANSDLAAFIQSWDWIGPGVYLGIEFDAYFNGDEAREQAFLKLLNATRARIESFGELVPLDYLAANVNLPIAYFTDAQPVGRLVRELAKLDELSRPHGQAHNQPTMKPFQSSVIRSFFLPDFSCN